MIARFFSLLVRVAAGTTVFVLVLAAVQSRDARISGMMLTFPALNGISLMMTRRADPRAMARSMLGVIALNGVVGLIFIEAFTATEALVGGSAAAYVWLMAGAAFLLWSLAFGAFSYGSGRADQWIFRAFLMAAPILACVWWKTCPLTLNNSAENAGFTQLVTMHAPRIVLLAFTLGLLLIVSEWLGAASTLLGRLGAFPLLPLFSLATIAQAKVPGGGAERLAVLKPTMLLGLLLAMAFAWVYSGYLTRLKRYTGTKWWIAASAGLIGGWLVCGALIVGTMRAIAWLEGCT